MSRRSRIREEQRRKRMRRKKIMFGVEVVVLVALGAVLFGYTWLNRSLEDNLYQEEIAMSEIEVNSEILESEEYQQQLSGTEIIALVGIDTRAEGDDWSESMNSDTIIVCVVDHDAKKIRMCSIMRDTWMDVAAAGSAEYQFDKANSAYAYGGATRMINMLNKNLDLQVSEYVTVNFKALADAIDVLGGLELWMTNGECVHANNYLYEVAEAQGVPYDAIQYDETQDSSFEAKHKLTGAQAVSYARIRYGGGDDAMRTSRQRIVIKAIVDKVKRNPAKIPRLMEEVLDNVITSMSSKEILKLGLNAISYDMEQSYAYPFELCYGDNVIASTGYDVVIPVQHSNNVEELHKYLYPNATYTMSSTVRAYSDYITEQSGYGADKIDLVLHQGPGADAISIVGGLEGAEVNQDELEELQAETLN